MSFFKVLTTNLIENFFKIVEILGLPFPLVMD